MFYDMHTHSHFSTDSNMSMLDATKTALDKGICGIAFTDHLDVEFTNHPNEFHYDYNEYFEHINAIKETFGNRIDIITATEVGLQPHVIDETIQRTNGFEFDFKIGSTHLINKYDPYEKTLYTLYESKQECYTEYLREIINNINLYSDYDALGHIDYIVRYAPYCDSVMYYQEFSDYIDEIFRFIIKKDIALEINTGTYKKVKLDINLIKRYKELGGELITIGSDSHSLSTVGYLFRDYADIIKSCGYEQLYYYKNRQPIGYNI